MDTKNGWADDSFSPSPEQKRVLWVQRGFIQREDIPLRKHVFSFKDRKSKW